MFWNYLMYYFLIGAMFSLIYNAKYMEENSEKLKELKATRSQKRKMFIIGFMIVLFIYPFTIIEEIVSAIKKKKARVKK